MIAPSTDIYLIKTPIEIDERNQLSFYNTSDQFNYFYNLPKLYLENATYQRKDEVLRYPNNGISFDELQKYNYCMYKNEAYSNKWFYAFVRSIKYVNDGMTEIKLETDVMQTWKFEIQYKNSFIEREHVTDDSFGKHTIPENLETGEYVQLGNQTQTTFLSDYYICFSVTKDLDGNSCQGSQINGVYSGLQYYLVRGEDHGGGPDTNPSVTIAKAANLFIYYYGNRGDLKLSQDNIESCFIVPRGIVDENKITWDDTVQTDPGTMPFSVGTIAPNSTAGLLTRYQIDVPSSLAGGYNPRNNKVKCYPYRYLLANNNAGTTVVYKYEDFKSILPNSFTLGFYCYGIISPGCAIKVVPRNYKNDEINYNEAINAGKLPVCSWIKDTYLNWQTQNSVNQIANVVGGVAKIGVGAATHDGEQAAQGINAIGDAVMAEYQHEFDPSQAMGNTNCGDINFPLGLSEVSLINMSIKPEYAAIIDSYFDHFGYRVNEFKKPVIQTRKNWNYIKTRGLNITGDIPQEDMQRIKNIFDNGITFWHHANTFLDYSQPNNII